MAGDEIERTVRKLAIDHAETGWVSCRFDSIDTQLRTLTQMVGQVLERLPEAPRS